jgi:hypothetical protein
MEVEPDQPLVIRAIGRRRAGDIGSTNWANPA